MCCSCFLRYFWSKQIQKINFLFIKLSENIYFNGVSTIACVQIYLEPKRGYLFHDTLNVKMINLLKSSPADIRLIARLHRPTLGWQGTHAVLWYLNMTSMTFGLNVEWPRARFTCF